MPKNSVRESFTVAIFSGIGKVRMREGEVSRNSVEKLLCHSADDFRSGDPFSVSLSSGIEKFYAPEGYVTNFDLLSNFYCFLVPNDFVGEPFCVSLVSGTEKTWIGGAGAIKNFRRKLFVLQCRKHPFCGTLQCFINFGYRKSLDKRGRGYQDIPSRIFCLTVPKISVGESFTVALNSGMEKLRCERWEYEEFLSETFCLTVPTISVVAIPSVFH